MDRARYKSDAKDAFKRNYWTCVIVSLVLFLFCTSHNGGSTSRNNSNSSHSGYYPGQTSYQSPGYQTPGSQNPGSNPSYDQILQLIDKSGNRSGETVVKGDQAGEPSSVSGTALSSVRIRALAVFQNLYRLFLNPGALAAVLWIVVIVTVSLIVIAYVLDAFIFSPLEVGGRRFYIDNAFGEDPSISRILYAFRSGHYLKIVAAMFVKKFLMSVMFIPLVVGAFLTGFTMNSPYTVVFIIAIILCLIGVLLLIPYIYLSYSWRLVPYVLADDPTLSPMAALKESNRLMNGFRFESFILDLSFILWNLLANVTIHIAGIFWVYPYKDATYAEMYLDLSGSSMPASKAPTQDRQDYRINNEEGFNWGD